MHRHTCIACYSLHCKCKIHTPLLQNPSLDSTQKIFQENLQALCIARIQPLPVPALVLPKNREGRKQWLVKSTKLVYIAVNYCQFLAFNVFLSSKIGIAVKNGHVQYCITL